MITWLNLVGHQVEQLPDKAALRARGRTGEDIQWTWTQYHEEVGDVNKKKDLHGDKHGAPNTIHPLLKAQYHEVDDVITVTQYLDHV